MEIPPYRTGVKAVTLVGMLDRQMKLLLRVGAVSVAITAVIAITAPTLLASALGLPLDLDPEMVLWTLRISGAVLLPLAGFMALAAAFFPERALRQSGALMMLFLVVASLLLMVAPTEWVWGRVTFLVLAGLALPLYFKALRARLRHR